MNAQALSDLPWLNFSFARGADFSQQLWLGPPRDVSGWAVRFTASGTAVSFPFPPATVVPPGSWYWPELAVVVALTPGLGVTPGVQPSLPASGQYATIVLDNAGAGGVSIIDAAGAGFQLDFAAALTAATPPQDLTWELRRVDSGFNTLLKSGTLTLTP